MPDLVQQNFPTWNDTAGGLSCTAVTGCATFENLQLFLAAVGSISYSKQKRKGRLIYARVRSNRPTRGLRSPFMNASALCLVFIFIFIFWLRLTTFPAGQCKVQLYKKSPILLFFIFIHQFPLPLTNNKYALFLCLVICAVYLLGMYIDSIVQYCTTAYALF